MKGYVDSSFDELLETLERLKPLAEETLHKMATLVVSAFRAKHRLFLFGNGGSAADAQHIAAEFVNRFEEERIALPAIALTTDTSIITSISNDRSFEDIFVRQLQALAEPGDVAFGISTSGNSRNIILALRWAKEHGLHTLGLAGGRETEMDIYCDLIIHVPSLKTPRIQECHILLGHVFCGLVERMMKNEMGTS